MLTAWGAATWPTGDQVCKGHTAARIPKPRKSKINANFCSPAVNVPGCIREIISKVFKPDLTKRYTIAGLVISALFMLRVVQKTFYGPKKEQYEQLPDVPFVLGIPRMMLVAVLLFFGLYPSLLFDIIETASVPFINGLP